MVNKVSDAYSLLDLNVPVSRLILDPFNPRIAIDLKSEGLAPINGQDLYDSSNQDLIQDLIFKKYRVKELEDSIQELGFIKGTNDIVVKEGERGRFIVLEGNRRITALRSILSDDSVSNSFRKSIEKIHVKKFQYIPNAKFEEEEVLDDLLAVIHITGPLQWGPIQQATQITKRLSRELGCSGTTFTVPLESAAANNAAAKLARNWEGYTTKKVKKEVAICLVFEQLQSAGYEVEPKHYSFIELVVTTRQLKNEYFGLDPQTLHLSNLGLQKFSMLILEEPRNITNPKLFKKFADIYRAGPKYLKRVENGAKVELVHLAVETLKAESKHVSLLSDVVSTLKKISPTDFNRTAEEKRLVNDAFELLSKLRRIVK